MVPPIDEPSATGKTKRIVREVQRESAYRGVSGVVLEAMKLGFTAGHPDWANLAQGEPESRSLEGAPPRIESIDLEPEDHAYGPLEGTLELRTAIANSANRLYRKDKGSQYGPENVAVAQGGRLSLARALHTLESRHLAYTRPGYPAWNEQLALHAARLQPIAISTSADDGFRIDPERLAQEIDDKRIRSFLFSNPCDPSGRVLEDEEQFELLRISRERGTVLLAEEPTCHYLYQENGSPAEAPTSMARHVEDVEEDPVLIFDGLSKNYRYPGWRIGWTLGPSSWIERITAAAIPLDGGPSRPIQRAAAQVLEPERADAEREASVRHFAKKRELMLKRLDQMGVRVPCPPRGGFYVFGDLSELPEPFCNAESFFRRALQQRVVTVPGRSFDVDPGAESSRSSEANQGEVRGGLESTSPYENWMRFSFAPSIDHLRMGLDRLAKMLRESV